MASLVASLFSGGMLDGLSKVINSIRGKNPGDAAALEALKEKYQTDFLTAQLEQRKLDLQELQMQADVNRTEAASTSLFVSGWRPFIGWVCGAGLASQFLVGPLVTFIAALFGKPIQYPQLDMGTLLTLLFGMLGLGYMRTAEKLKGVGKENV